MKNKVLYKMNYRKRLIEWLFEISQKAYLLLKKKQPWAITNAQLLVMPSNTFGYQLGIFLQNQGFQLIPKVERHDAYHLLTGFSTSVQDEIALQYVCFGNGKRTPYLLGVLILGTLLLPEYASYYKQAYSFGRQSNHFHHFDFKHVLPIDYDLFRSTVFSETIQQGLRKLQKQYNQELNQIQTL